MKTGYNLRKLFLAFGLSGLSMAPTYAQSNVEILRDDWGVPHVYSADVYGLYAGFGYVVAQDRLFQMEMAKRSVLGTVSEVLGIDRLPYDIQTRANFSHAEIKQQIEQLNPEERAILKGYAAGYNRRVHEVLASPDTLLPKEFSDFGITPTTWTDFDVAMIYVGTMAGRFSHYSTELANAKLLAALEKQHGSEKAKALFEQMFWLEDPLAPTTVPKGEQYKKAETLKLDGIRFADLLDSTVPGGDDMRPRASNIWIVGPKKTIDGSTILVNGPQFDNFNPSYVFSIGLHGAGFDLTGNTPFAVPNVLFGTNGKIAWGATAGPLDVNDYFKLDLNPQNSTKYRVGHNWVDMHPRKETFHVKGSPDVETTVYESEYGVVSLIDKKSNSAYAFKRSWKGKEIQTLFAWINSTKAQTFNEWLAQARKVATTINWYYADREGNIGYVSPGLLPIRSPQQDIRLPAKGDGTQDWSGTQPFANVPKTYNPSQNYIANWNNRSAHGAVATVEGSGWGSADRVLEITTRLESKDKLTPQEVWDINRQISFLDVNARYFLPYILDATKDVADNDPRQPMIAALKAWDGQQLRGADGRATTPAVAIFRRWLETMVRDVLLDDSPIIPATIQYGRISRAAQILHNAMLADKAGVPQTYDFFNGADAKGRQQIILSALEKTGNSLKDEYSSGDVSNWRVPLPQHVFETSNYMGIPQANPDEGKAIATSMNRGTQSDMVTFRDGKVSFCAVTPPGQSGFIDPTGKRSPHYEDQLDLYQRFECRPQAFLRADVEKAARETIRFRIE
ncbi:penicillin acylase family protein [Phyllobacterium sp. OV277]|uniref:penicillin acylase family protein n=1 Tax=Phyllobacterium sp. OV277 TaxID=1882772 RepID=UPI0008837B3E|nr:penicillin acylase family protein [Phyllobacterium sp. OV277]SDO50647.1 penicillin amidase [Phyllobacterium sp. OV277]